LDRRTIRRDSSEVERTWTLARGHSTDQVLYLSLEVRVSHSECRSAMAKWGIWIVDWGMNRLPRAYSVALLQACSRRHPHCAGSRRQGSRAPGHGARIEARGGWRSGWASRCVGAHKVSLDTAVRDRADRSVDLWLRLGLANSHRRAGLFLTGTAGDLGRSNGRAPVRMNRPHRA